VKINKMSGKKRGVYFLVFLVNEKKKDIIKEKGETQLLGSFRFTNGG
jgi:hypothetical protein